ncbi:MAG: helix-hairpin-helix domain-containing protein [Bacteroidetes bacterium]|nr:helix-hairpin-helix domain-containing protein [Bacteroidota bacterium]
MKNIVLSLFIIFVIVTNINAQSSVVSNDNLFVLLKPIGTKGKLTVCTPFDKKTAEYKIAKRLFDSTYLHQTLRLYQFVNQYQLNRGKTKQMEPAYLLLSGNEGGYARTGFILKEGRKEIVKEKTPFVDLARLPRDDEDNGHFTQIFPHESGHVFQRLLTATPEPLLTASIDMHYFCLTTDYFTAFSEGFAEHFEPSSYQNETHKVTRQSIEKEIAHSRSSFSLKQEAFVRDYSWPFRISFYRLSMLFWFQPIENLRRYDLAINGDVKYANKSGYFNDLEQNILFRNTGVLREKMLRNEANANATEGVISSFFLRLVNSPLKARYGVDSVYAPFFFETKLPAHFQAAHYFTPLENEYLKIFTVIAKYVNPQQSKGSLLGDFIAGYCVEFPAEGEKIRSIYQETTGYKFTGKIVPEIWLNAYDIDHHYWVMGQFGSTLPFHRFNINTCDAVDIMALKGVDSKQANAIIAYRNKIGGFGTIHDLAATPGLDVTTLKLFQHAVSDGKELESTIQGLKLSFTKVLVDTLKPLFLRSLLGFGLFLSLFILLFRKHYHGFKAWFWLIVRKLGKWLLLLILSTVCVIMIPVPLYLFTLFVAILVGIAFLTCRRKPLRRTESIITTLLMFVILGYSLF